VPTTRIKLKVIPGASNSAIKGWMGDALKIRVSAAPEKGKANKEVLAIMSKALSVQISELSLISGQTSPHKTIEILGLPQEEVEGRIAAVLESGIKS
jgi:uncharacterized protein (TIGR00251 family)